MRVSTTSGAGSLTFLVVGGGASSVELTGELCDMRDAALALLYPQQALARVVLVHGGDELLPQFDADLRAKALASLRARGVEVRLGARRRGADAAAHRPPVHRGAVGRRRGGARG